MSAAQREAADGTYGPNCDEQRSAPRASLLLLTYNQRAFVRAAAESCFAQDCEPIEILFTDDASADGTYEELLDLAACYRGPHTVRVRRNVTNLGIGAHYNAAIAASRGELLITAGGDDISLPHRVKTLLAAWDAMGGNADLISSAVVDMHVDGSVHGVLRVSDLACWTRPDDWVRKRPYVIGASHAFTRRMHRHFGDFVEALAYEDQVMALRACSLGGSVTVTEPLLCYRRGGLSALGDAAATPQGFLRWSLRKHERQQALYEQVKRDLATAGRMDLWCGKPKRAARRSALALRMLTEPRAMQRLLLALRPRAAGIFWALRHGLYFTAPQVAVAIRAAQKLVKRCMR